MSAYDTITTGLSGLGLVLTSFVAIYGTSDFHLNAQQLEADLLDRSVVALEEAGLSWARVRVDGQKAFLSGAAPNSAAKEVAVAVVSEAAGVGGPWYGGIIDVATDFTEADGFGEIAPYVWRATKTIEGNIVFLGHVPSNTVRAALIDTVDVGATGIVSDRLEIRPDTPAADWAEMAAFGLENLQLLDSGEVRLSDLDLRLSGVSMLDASRIRAEAAVANVAAPWSGAAYITGPSHWKAVHIDDTLVLSGSCESEALCAEIVTIANTYFDGEVVNEMQEAASTYEDWIGGVRAGLPHFSQFQSGNMRFAPDTDGFAFEGDASSSTLQFLREDMAALDGAYAVAIMADRQAVELSELDGIELDANPLIACQSSFDLVMQANKVIFETASADISRASGLTLDKIMAVSERCDTGLRFEIIGHTDNVGDRAANIVLSTARAQAVADYMDLAGFDVSRLVVTGRGPDDAVADNASEAGRAANRRIEFSVQDWSE